jgi:hypothetical protein
MKNAYKVLVKNPEGKRPFRRHRHCCEDNIRIDFSEIWWEGMNWLRIETSGRLL